MFKLITISSIAAMLLLSGCGSDDTDSPTTPAEVIVDDGTDNNPPADEQTTPSSNTPAVTTTDTLQLVDAAGTPLPEGASVTIIESGDTAANAPQLQKASELPFTVGSDGLLKVTELSAGSYKVVITVGGVESIIFLDIPEENFQKLANVTVPVIVDKDGDATVVDAVIASISGTVYNSTGAPIVNAQVSLSGGSKTNGSFVTAFTDANGAYSLNINTSKDNTVALLNATIFVKADGYAPHAEDIEVVNKTNVTGVNFLLSEATQTASLYSETFEGDTSGWIVDKTSGNDENNVWHIHTAGLNISSASYLNGLVQLAPNDLSNGRIPDPVEGKKAFWYGDGVSDTISLGSFIGETYETELSNLTGGTSNSQNSATLTSPLIDLSNASGAINLSFKTWWEIESVNPNANGFDVMTISVSTDNGDSWRAIAKLNPLSDPEVGNVDRSPIPFSNTGYNSAPLWQDQEGISLLDENGESLAGQMIKIRYTFETVDSLYNGFRGWMIDDVEINSGEGTFPLLTSYGDFDNNYDFPSNTFYPVTVSPSSFDGYNINPLTAGVEQYFTVALNYSSDVEVEFTMELRDSLSNEVLAPNLATEVAAVSDSATNVYDYYGQTNLTLSGTATVPNPDSGTLSLWIIMKDNATKDVLLEYPVDYYEVNVGQQ